MYLIVFIIFAISSLELVGNCIALFGIIHYHIWHVHNLFYVNPRDSRLQQKFRPFLNFSNPFLFIQFLNFQNSPSLKTVSETSFDLKSSQKWKILNILTVSNISEIVSIKIFIEQNVRKSRGSYTKNINRCRIRHTVKNSMVN